MALRVLREMVRCHPEPFHSYAELTIVKLLEAHKDPVKEVLVNLTHFVNSMQLYSLCPNLFLGHYCRI